MALTSGNFLTNSGTPLVGNGSNGDHYRNTDNEDLWFKQLGVWTLVGNVNDDAADGVGTIWLSGSGTPLTGNGDNGNYYRNSDNQDLWYKVDGFWTLIGTLLPVAAEGTMILSGSGVPSGGTGVDDDYYRDTVTQDIYLKTAGVWNLIGSWAAVTAGTTILSGSGVPSNGSGSDGNYYFNSVNQDIYFKSGGIWTLIGSWAAGGATAFVVGTWNMTGATTTAEPVSTLAATVGGVAPDFELTPTAPLAGGPGTYLAIAASATGIAKTGTGQRFAKVTLPAFDAGDNLMAVGFFLANSSATELDITALLNGGVPTNAVWGTNLSILSPFVGGTCSSTSYVNNVAGSPVAGPSGWVNSDIAYFGMDYDTGNVVVQQNAGAVTQLGALDLTGLSGADSLKIFFLLACVATPAVILDAPVVFSMGTTDGGKTAFTAMGEATLPVGAADGLVYEVTVAGIFGGSQTTVGDFVQLYDTTSKIIVTPTGLQAEVGSQDARLDAIEANEALVGTVDVLGQDTVTAGSHAFGVANAGAVKFLSITAAGQTFLLSAASGKVVRLFVQPTLSAYTPGGADLVTINNIKFLADGSETMTLEVYHDLENSLLQTKFYRYPTTNPACTVAVTDADTAGLDIPHCSGDTVTVDNTALTVDMATFSLTGSQWTYLLGLREVIRINIGTGSAFGVTNFDGSGLALAAGDSVLRFRNGAYLKV